ncbi:hypothetical protein AX17_001260 [Amanita inopinata Kibby_2008]|nr:hypothetical protein AX17_001260 [Amanita inopinata Kibby_2008]
MSTSELSNALNPYATQDRNGTLFTDYSASSLHQVITPPQQYAPHRSELELAISEPQPPAPPPPARPAALRPRGQFSQEGVQAVQELIRLVSTTRDAHEIERKRRLAWEQEQEAKFAQRQAETERCMLEMRQEIQTLRAMLGSNGKPLISSQQALQVSKSPLEQQPTRQPVTGLFMPHSSMSPAMQGQSIPLQTPTSQCSTLSQSTFVQGSSNNPTYPQTFNQQMPQQLHSPQTHMLSQQAQQQHVYQNNTRLPQQQQFLQQFGTHSSEASTTSEPLSQSVTPSPSPQLTLSQSQTDPRTRNATGRKGTMIESSNDDDEVDSMNSDGSDAAPVSRVRRTNHHDRRCLTVHHAMRVHLLRCMDLESDKELPDSHSEGAVLKSTEPVRFVWNKTTKQSVHNARMKSRIISDIKAKRMLYRHVPDKEFNKKILEAAFDQCFTTFRQKFKAQRDAVIAMNLKQREDQKARKARHLSRRKLKLSNRADARMKIEAFEHVIFDGALQLECMSSEESESETDASSSTSGILCTRGYAWRSARLVQFYCALDNEERVDKSTKPKRGMGKKGRRVGPLKEGFHLPPKGVAMWMVSRRWLRTARHSQSNLPEMLSKLVFDPPGFEWEHFNALGGESDAEGDEHDGQHQMPQGDVQNIHMHDMQSTLQIPQQHYTSSSSLNYALM